jgi:hypothetical protein
MGSPPIQITQAPPLNAGAAPFLAKATPFWLPMRHFVAAAFSFWLFAAALAWGNERLLGFSFDASWALGLTHLLTLGWVTMTIMGALIQLMVVVHEVPFSAPGRLAWAWALLTAGTAGFVGSLWAGWDRYWIPAALAFAGVIVYLQVFVESLLKGGKLDWSGRHIALALSYLSLVILLGLMLAYDRERGLIFRDPRGVLIAHIHLALIGWVTLMIVGVSYRLVAMFSLSHIESKTPGIAALILANIGLTGLVLDCLFASRRLLPVWATILAAAYAAYAYQMNGIFRGRLRRIDPALGYTLLALFGGAVWAALGLGLSFGFVPDDTPREIAYILAALLGWVTPFILGQIHKIVPFLVWLHVFSPKNWRPPLQIPRTQDLASEKAAWWEMGFLAAAAYALIGGFLLESPGLIRLGSWSLLSCATLYAANTALTLSFLKRPWTPSKSRP